jgi:hypothetical protein
LIDREPIEARAEAAMTRASTRVARILFIGFLLSVVDMKARDRKTDQFRMGRWNSCGRKLGICARGLASHAVVGKETKVKLAGRTPPAMSTFWDELAGALLE